MGKPHFKVPKPSVFFIHFLLLNFIQGSCHKLLRSGCPCLPGTLPVLQQSSPLASIAIGHTASEKGGGEKRRSPWVGWIRFRQKNLPCFYSSPVENFGLVEEKKLLTSSSHIVTSLGIKPLYWWSLVHLLVKGMIVSRGQILKYQYDQSRVVNNSKIKLFSLYSLKKLFFTFILIPSLPLCSIG